MPTRHLKLPEFIAMLAMLFATIAFSIDAMLPALPEIAAELTPFAVNRAQLVLVAFVLGIGLGTLFAGPISDATGRKPAITAGFIIYIVGAGLAIVADSIETLLIARFIQGLGAAGPRIVGLALIRDLYQGREMARVTSFVMMVFILVPAVAPAIGQGIIALTGWRGVFAAFILFGLACIAWLNIRQDETLPPERRRPLNARLLLSAAREVWADRNVRIYTAVMTLGFAQMFALLASAQQLFADTYGIRETFPAWFAAMALLAGTGSILNARLVMRLGMRRMTTAAYATQTVLAAVFLMAVLSGALPDWAAFPAFFAWAVSIFFMAGVTFGNLNALALERMGHIAGMAASLVAAAATVLSVVLATPVGLAYDGTVVPVLVATLVASALAWLLMRQSENIG